MKRKVLVLALTAASGLVLVSLAQTTQPAAPATGGATTQPAAQSAAPALETLEQKASYAIGQSIGNDLKHLPAQLDLELVVRGLRDSMSDQPALISAEDGQQALASLQQEMMAKHAAQMKEQGMKGAAEAKAFLDANKQKKGVKTTASGLQYEVLNEGKGQKPTANDTVTVHYRGTLLDGKEFDSSYSRGEPATFPLGGVIKGWTEGLQLIKAGGKIRLFVPPDLAYGEQGAGNDIPPNSALIFDVELLDVKAGGGQPGLPPGHPNVR